MYFQALQNILKNKTNTAINILLDFAKKIPDNETKRNLDGWSFDELQLILPNITEDKKIDIIKLMIQFFHGNIVSVDFIASLEQMNAKK